VTATLLPIPDDPRFERIYDLWPEWAETYARASFSTPRAVWLGLFERLLREFYPSANSDSLTLTARHAAPFPLALGPDVP
jgi:hypothetical protein